MVNVRENVSEDDALSAVALAHRTLGQSAPGMEDVVDLAVDDPGYLLRRSPLFVVGRRASIVGYIRGVEQARLVGGNVYRSDSTIEVASLAVDEVHRRRGYASALLERLMGFTKARRYQQLVAQVPEGLSELFAGCGFEVSPSGWAWLESSSYRDEDNKRINADGFDARLVQFRPDVARGRTAVAWYPGEVELAVPIGDDVSKAELIDRIVDRGEGADWVRRSLDSGTLATRGNWELV